jgi:Fic family protein
MRFPATPPKWTEILEILQSGDKLDKFFQVARQEPPQGYLHWDQLRRLPNVPQGLTHAEWWAIIKFRRRSSLQYFRLTDKKGVNFCFSLPDTLYQELHEIDRGAGNMLTAAAPIVNPQSRDQYLISSLINEAITSSQLEGAVTTRAVAKEMIRTGRKPHDRSERMILNNYVTMQRIREVRTEKLSKELIFDLHRTVTEGTLEKDDAAGRFRAATENVWVEDDRGEVFHTPPPADELDARMQAMCDFANGLTPKYFIHPVVRAILLHFWLAYDHPFVDGNGRTARALFYWAMLHSGYWLFEFISISEVILESSKRYYLAFLYSETDENDTTYFVIHQLNVIKKAIEGLHAYIARKSAELSESEQLLRDWSSSLNHRQLALISHALRHPEMSYTVEAHQRSHGTVYETARRDLLDLVKSGLLIKGKSGRTMVFRPPADFSERIKRGVQSDALIGVVH